MLVTGSREWEHPSSLDIVLGHYGRHYATPEVPLTVVHGAALKGADMLAARWVGQRQRQGWPVDQERYPADWGAPCVEQCKPGHRQRRGDGSDFCPFAGFRRNQQMVDTAPLLVVGFWRNGSSGTRDCLKRAAKANLTVWKIAWQARELITPEWVVQNAPPLGPA